MKRRFAALLVAVLAVLMLATGCSHKSDTVSKNISQDADSYKVFRRIVVYNSITDTIILEVDGFCALGNDDPIQYVSYTCKGRDGYIKDIINRSDNTMVFEHQINAVKVSDTFFQVVVRPETIIPDINFQ